MRFNTVVQLLVSLNMIVPIFALPFAYTALVPFPGAPMSAEVIAPSGIPSPPSPPGMGGTGHPNPAALANPHPIRRFGAGLERRVVREADFGASPDATAQPETAMPASTPAPEAETDSKKAASIVERRVVREADFGASPNSTEPGTAAPSPAPAAALQKRSAENKHGKSKSKGHGADEDASVVPSMPDASAPSLSGSSLAGAFVSGTKQVGSIHHAMPNPLADTIVPNPSSATGTAPVPASAPAPAPAPAPAVAPTRREHSEDSLNSRGTSYFPRGIPQFSKGHSLVLDTDPILRQDETRPGSPPGADGKNVGVVNLDSNEQAKPVKSKVASSTQAASTETATTAIASPTAR